MIEAKGIYKSFGNVDVIKGIDIHIDKSEIVTIVGASGAGKSTLLQIIGTLEKADKGEVIINGQNVNTLSQKKLAAFRKTSDLYSNSIICCPNSPLLRISASRLSSPEKVKEIL